MLFLGFGTISISRVTMSPRSRGEGITRLRQTWLVTASGYPPHITIPKSPFQTGFSDLTCPRTTSVDIPWAKRTLWM